MRIFTFLVMGLMLLSGAAHAQDRIALVIGNANYTSVSALDNATNDAGLISASLRDVGFDVTMMQDTSQAELKRAIADFGRRLRAAGPETVGLFYYAGHGVQSFGANYLLPVDAVLSDAADLDLVALEAASVLRQMASARNKSNIVILDACRNNPFQDVLALNDNGLAEMNAPTGTFLAYATSPGAVALDGRGANSPFTAALARSIQIEGLPIEQVFKQVRVEVIEKTAGAQTPWDTSSLTQDFVFRAAAELTAEEIAERQLWESVEASRDPVQLMLFLRSYPGGTFEAEARALLAEAMAAELDAKDAQEEPKAPTPQAEPATDMERQAALMEVARSTGARADYQAYLDAFPQGVFAELVKIEIAGLDAKSTASEETNVAQADGAATETMAADAPVFEVFYDVPLSEGAPQILGKTIPQIAQGTPLFPPIEGLPENLWKEKSCTSCHTWTRDDLCDQAKVYVGQPLSRAIGKQHPYGGSFKESLRNWGLGGCR